MYPVNTQWDNLQENHYQAVKTIVKDAMQAVNSLQPQLQERLIKELIPDKILEVICDIYQRMLSGHI